MIDNRKLEVTKLCGAADRCRSCRTSARDFARTSSAAITPPMFDSGTCHHHACSMALGTSARHYPHIIQCINGEYEKPTNIASISQYSKTILVLTATISMSALTLTATTFCLRIVPQRQWQLLALARNIRCPTHTRRGITLGSRPPAA